MTPNVISGIEHRNIRKIIIEGISRDLKHSEIASQLGVNRRVIFHVLKMMRKEGDPELKQAVREQENTRLNQPSITHILNERFMHMTGMTFKEKTFHNMIDFYKPELSKILKSRDQYVAINKLEKSVRKTLRKNGIITDGWHKAEITSHAQNYLSKPGH